MNQKRKLLLGLFGLILLASVILFFTRIADYPAAQAVLLVRSGSAVIAHGGGQPESVDTSGQATVNNRDSITVNGVSSIMFAGAQMDLAPGTELEIIRYGALGDESQLELLVKAGQTWQRINDYQDGRSAYRIRTPIGMAVTRGGGLMVNLTDNDTLQVGIVSGEATVTAQNRSVTLADGQGTEIVSGQAPLETVPWSRVRALTYRPDGSPVTLPVTLLNPKTGDHYQLQSPNTYIVPTASYNMTVEALESFQSYDMVLSPDSLTELPVTLSEVMFMTTDVDGREVPYTGLTVQGSITTRAVPDAPVLISPGKWTVFAAREEKPGAIQGVTVESSPGQRVMVSLRNDLFGGGSVAVHITTMDGSTVPPVSVFVYATGIENGQPLLTFKSDTAPQALPQGNYVVSVRTALAQRFAVTIQQNQNVPLQVQLGTLSVNYTDALARANPKGPLVYIASSPDMQRLGLSMLQMRQTPYGMAIPCCQPVLVPAGVYNVMVDDSKDVGQQNVLVEAGKTKQIDLTAIP